MNHHSIHDTAQVTGISVRSLRNYLRLYRDQLHPLRGPCNSLLFGDDDIETFVKIRALLREGRSRPQIIEMLTEGTPPGEMVIRRTEAEEATPPPGEATTSLLSPRDLAVAEALAEQLRIQTHLMERLVDENAALRRRLERIEDRLPDGVPRRKRVRSRGELAIPLPYFLLRASDGARALLSGIVTVLRPNRALPATASRTEPS